MRVDVRVFGALKDSAPAERWLLEVPEGADVSGALALLRERLDEAVFRALTADNVKVAVNQTIITSTTGAPLKDGDELAFLPPVTGG